MKSMVAALAATLIACGGAATSGGGAPAMSTEEAQAALRANAWELVQLPGISTLPGSERPFLEFGEDGRATGYSGCNQMGGAYDVDGTSLTFGPMVMTRRACLDNRQEVENTFARAIEATARLRVQDGALSLLGEDGGLLARLVPRGT